ncbi:DUF4124 domain-containing protein [Variovorax sp. UMC13]|uniref:DUF4124 domain-containing protein n=1 Tax=Variovorax sp. UMC13 TaxID=1862326 RepID=UPI0016042D8F|nr:DUF4124 domain-containing protein [Variovorax sp. UMC13]MBB1604687.1 DUF4124 domain-containing protein [Variovorax sp. UMC13]
MALQDRTHAGAWSMLLPLLAAGTVAAQSASPSGGSIYSCTDARGRTLTADRPIPDCSDREQRALSPSGARRIVEPSYTAQEQAERDERARQAAQQAARLNEERRRERALLMRYPNLATHERERVEAMQQIDTVIDAARKRVSELAKERQSVDDEMEFYKKDVSKAPPSLRRKLEDNEQSVAVQNRFIAAQDDEKKRVNARFDEERVRLKPLWAANAPPGGAGAGR